MLMKSLRRLGLDLVVLPPSSSSVCVPLVFKVAHAPEHHETLRKEYEALIHLFRTCNKTSFFSIPKPVAFHYSQDNFLLSAEPKLRSPGNMRNTHLQPVPMKSSFFDALQNDNLVLTSPKTSYTSLWEKGMTPGGNRQGFPFPLL